MGFVAVEDSNFNFMVTIPFEFSEENLTAHQNSVLTDGFVYVPALAGCLLWHSLIEKLDVDYPQEGYDE